MPLCNDPPPPGLIEDKVPFVRAILLIAALTVSLAAAAQQSGTVVSQSGVGTPGALAPPTSTAPKTGAISGVVNDAATHRPIAGALVSLRLDGGGLQAQMTRQMTDALGRYVFQELGAGARYSVIVTKFGYLDGNYGQATILAPGVKFALAHAEWRQNVDVLLFKPGAISGTVLDEAGEPVVGAYVRVLAQQLVSGEARLLAGAAAQTDDRGDYRIPGLPPGKYLIDVPSVQSTVPASTPVSSLGTTISPEERLNRQVMGFSIGTSSRVDAPLDLDASSRLLIGTYVTPPAPVDGHAEAYPITFFPGATSIAGATAIDLTGGEERHGIDIHLQPVRSARIFGTVEGATGTTAGMLLRLMPAGLEDLGGGSEAATTLVAADGSFAFLNVPAGTYTIDARRATFELIQGSSMTTLPQPPGFINGGMSSGSLPALPPGTGYQSKSGAPGEAYWGRTPVTVADADVSGVSVKLNHSVSLTGRVVFEGTATVTIQRSYAGAGGVSSNATLAASAPPQPSALPGVMAEPANGDPSLGMPRNNFNSPDDGSNSFTIEGLMPGEYVLRFQTPMNYGYIVKSITIDGDDYTRRPFDTSAGKNLNNVVVTFTDKLITLTGQVLAGQGAVDDGAVIVFPVERDQWTRYGFTPARFRGVVVPTTTGFRIDDLPPGDYYVIGVDASLANAWQDPKFLDAAVPLATRVSLQWGESKAQDVKLVTIK